MQKGALCNDLTICSMGTRSTMMGTHFNYLKSADLLDASKALVRMLVFSH
jgi:hypothetical protein